MIRLLIEERSGYHLYMESDGFTKRFYVTDLNDVFAFWDAKHKGQFFDSIIEASRSFEESIYGPYFDREEVRE